MKSEVKKAVPAYVWKRGRYLKKLLAHLGTYKNEPYSLPNSETDFSFITNEGNSWYEGLPERGLISEIEKKVNGETVFYDVGAHYGFHSTAACAAGVHPDQTHAFEAALFPHHVLRKNASRVGFTAVHAFVGEGGSELSIDEYTKRNLDPTLVKIDVEGAEGSVLSGMKNTIQRSKPTLLIEMHPSKIENFPCGIEYIFQTLEGSGYNLSAVRNEPHYEEIADVSPSTFLGFPDLSLRAVYP